MFGLLKRRRRRRLRERPFPDAWSAVIERNVPYCRLLSDAEREALREHVQILLHEKHFEGCGGLVLTDEIRVTIAAQACLLLLNRETDYFPKLTSVLVYPARYVAETTQPQPDGTVVEGPQVRAGESWQRGAVVLSWDDARHAAFDFRDGHNVVLHEFAHQLDAESGLMNGTPLLPAGAMYAAWARVMQREFEQLQADVRARRRTVLRPYGATNPAEFFAVATETFFEQPVALEARHAALYEQLAQFYNQHPAARVRGQAGTR